MIEPPRLTMPVTRRAAHRDIGEAHAGMDGEVNPRPARIGSISVSRKISQVRSSALPSTFSSA